MGAAPSWAGTEHLHPQRRQAPAAMLTGQKAGVPPHFPKLCVQGLWRMFQHDQPLVGKGGLQNHSISQIATGEARGVFAGRFAAQIALLLTS